MSDENEPGILRSPLSITIALHYWARPERYAWREPNHANSEAVREIKNAMVEAGLLIPRLNPQRLEDPDYVPVREALKLYVEALFAVPWPVRKWTMPS